MVRIITVFAFLAAFAGTLTAQENKEEVKKRLLDKVRAKIRAEHKKILKQVGEAIDTELAKIKPKKDGPAAKSEFDKKIKEIERALKKLELQKEALANAKRKLERYKEDEKLAKKAQGEEFDAQEAREIFDEALAQHNEEKFDASIPAFKKLFYASPKSPLGYTSAYNVCCGYALDGDKDRALDWLEIAIEFGFNNFDHMRTDTDLETLRKSTRYKRLMADK